MSPFPFPFLFPVPFPFYLLSATAWSSCFRLYTAYAYGQELEDQAIP